MTLLKEIANDSLAENTKLKAEIERLREALNEALNALAAIGDDLTGENRANQIRKDYAIEQAAQPGEPQKGV
jgi:regulator of replication initiation timing